MNPLEKTVYREIEEHSGDDRLQHYQYQPPQRLRRFNRMYSTLREAENLGKVADVGTTVTANVSNNSTLFITLPTPQGFRIRLSEWPDAVSAHLMVRHFSAAPRLSTGTGVISAQYIGLGGTSIPLTDFFAGGNSALVSQSLDPIPVTDPTPPNLGQIFITYYGGSAAIDLVMTIGFSIIYLVAATEPYND